MRLSGGSRDAGLTLSSELLCIALAVASDRMRAPLNWPFCRCAIMKLAMSVPLADRPPAGAELTTSKPSDGWPGLL